MQVVGIFTMSYRLIVEGIKQLPNLFNLFTKTSFLLQEIIFIILISVFLPKLLNFIDWLKLKKEELDNSL